MSLSSSFARRLVPFTPPSFIPPSALATAPASYLPLCNLPTPIHRLPSPSSISSLVPSLLVKRDDATGGTELGGNKLRKLEFLLAAAISEGADTVVTIGGIQSNHCRATACAARAAGLDAHLILRCSDPSSDVASAPSLGNLLFSRSAGAVLHTVSKEEYGRHGSTKLVDAVCETLRSEGLSPYAIPVGGSNALGTWGYVRVSPSTLSSPIVPLLSSSLHPS